MNTTSARTIPQLFEESVRRYGNNIMMWEKRASSYEGTTYREIQRLVLHCAAGLLSLGLQKGDRVALISEGRNDWVIAELGIVYAGAVNVPISVKIEELSELKFRLAHSECRMVIVSGSQAHKIFKIKNDLPDLEKIVLLDPFETTHEDAIPFAEVLEKGKKHLASHEEEFQSRWQSIRGEDAANICYTSGTTADPKGIILTHRNYTANVEQACQHLPLPDTSCSLLILPWDHSFAHTAGVYLLMNIGASMASVQAGKSPMETLRNIPANIKEVRPTFLLSVPALAKNFQKNIEKGVREKGGFIERLFRRALEVAYAYNAEGWNRGEGTQKLRKLEYMLYDALIFRKVRQNFGARLEFFIGGGAFLDIEMQRFFYAIGIPMYQGYGLTEAAPIISANTPRKHKLGSSGTIMPNLQLKICDERGQDVPRGHQGEIVVKGENVMAGYWKNEKATREVLCEGWLRTGDVGYLDNDGFLFVLGREKSLLISSDGEKFSPEGIEETIVAHSPYIDQMMLYNDHSMYTVALVVPNRESLLAWLNARKLSCHGTEGQDAVLRLVRSEVDAFRSVGRHGGMFPERWLPSAIAVLGEGFTEQNRFMNSTLKMVRGRIVEFYRNRIDFLFTTEGKDICNHQNRTIIKRLEEAG